MKKCPYCKTLTTNEAKTCPNCLHDLSEINPMPDPINKKFSSQIYFMIFGFLISFGGLVATLSQRINYLHFLDLAKKDGLNSEEIRKYLDLANHYQFKMIMMIVLSSIGIIVLLIGVVLFFIKLVRRFKKQNSD